MLKHPDITARRIQEFLRFELKEKLIGERVPLSIEFCPEPHATQNLAKEHGPWQTVEPGFEYGPSYRVVWFRLKGRAPAGWADKSLAISAEVGGERTVWAGNSPVRGIDEPHSLLPLVGKGDDPLLPMKGAKDLVEMYVQVVTTNPQVSVYRYSPPREAKVERVKHAQIVQIDLDLQALYYDVAFALHLLEAFEGQPNAYATVLRVLNTVCNVFKQEQRDTLSRCRKLIRNALGSLNGELKHAITPVGHAHLDTAWLWPLAVTRLKMAHTASTQLDLIERYPEYVFVHSQASQYEWLEREYPTLFKRVQEAVKRGQWEPVGSMWVEADCNLTGSEALVRQFLYGRRFFEKRFGTVTEDMWLPDVFGYSAAIPQILEKFGIKYFMTQKISWNQFNKFPHNTFWWQGIDGSKVWSHFPPADTYCGNCEPTQILQSVRNHRDHARSDHSLYVFGFGDGGGGPTEQHLEFLRRARTAPGLPVIESRRLAREFFAEAKEKSRDLMTWTGELYFELHRGTYTSQARNKKGNRECEFLMRDAEFLACFRDDYPIGYPAAECERLWKVVLLNQFHDIIPGSSVREVYEESDRDYALVREGATRLIDDGLRNIAAKLDRSAMRCPVALFQNATTPGQASIPWSKEEAPTTISTADEVLPVQLVEAFGERNLIFATPHAALGTVCVADLGSGSHPRTGRLKIGPRRIETNELCVKFDSNGNITSVASMDERPVEFITPGKLANVFQVFEDKPLFWSAWDVDVYALESSRDLLKCESFEVRERGPVRAAVEVVRRFGKSTIRQRISLGQVPGIRFDTEIDWHEDEKLLKVAFPINVNAQRATYEIQFGNVERPTHYNTTWDLARFEVCAQKWVDFSEGGHGVAMLNDCKYGHDVHDGVLRLSLLRSPKAPDPMCDMGLHRFTYIVQPHFDGYNHGDVVAASYALNAPVRHALMKPGAGEKGELPRLLSCDSRDIVIEAVKKAEDSKHIVVRAYECHNSRGSTELICARGIKRAWLADLNEKPIAEIEIVDKMAPFEYKPFEILTFLLEV